MTYANTPIIATVATRLHKRFPVVERQDIVQELWVQGLSEEWWGIDLDQIDPETDNGDAIREAERILSGRLRRAGERFCRREKAALGGYETQDESFYSLGRLKDLLEALLSSGVQEHPPAGRSDAVRHSGTDGAEAGTWLASLVDVKSGLERLRPVHQHRLMSRYGLHAGASDEDYAMETYQSLDQARGRVRRALRALQRELGGSNPWNKGPTPRRAETAPELI